MTPTNTFTASPTPTSTNTPQIATYVTSQSYSFANSPTITIPWTPSISGVNELLVVIVSTNNTDDQSVVQGVSYAGNSFYGPFVQQPSLQYCEGIELWTFSLGSYPYSGFTSGNIVITQPSYNSIINDNVVVLEYSGAAQLATPNVSAFSSAQQAQQQTFLGLTLQPVFQNSTIIAAYSGVKGLVPYNGNQYAGSLWTTRKYFHKYGTFSACDDYYRAPVSLTSSLYQSLPPNNPAASVLMAEIPSFSYFTPTPTPHP